MELSFSGGQSCLLLPQLSSQLDLWAGGSTLAQIQSWEGEWLFPGHWRTLFTPSHLLGFHPGSRLSGGRQGHSNPPTTGADVAGEGTTTALPFRL